MFLPVSYFYLFQNNSRKRSIHEMFENVADEINIKRVKKCCKTNIADYKFNYPAKKLFLWTDNLQYEPLALTHLKNKNNSSSKVCSSTI